MIIWLILAFISAAIELIAISKNLHNLEYFAKPGVMVFLFLWLYTTTGLQGHMLWFGIGLVFSLLGDVFLLVPNDRMFIPGLVAFLFTHICYLIGLQEQLLSPTVWSLMLMVVIVLSGIRLLRRIVSAMHAKDRHDLAKPVVFYGLVISLMLAAAMSTLSDTIWKAGAALLVSAGALLFWISDLMLAWNKFVSPIQGGRILIILAYHLGQIGIIAGVISQFS
ncbi:MAG TPA: lysoplasmalogenase [Anaerolineales bacterium]|nr:lysoplasmalogenase [Anaerolineales bacterium]